MQNTIVYLIRHSTTERPMQAGQPVIYGPDAPLTRGGKQKAQKLRAVILAREGKPFDVIYTSPLKRAYETARILAGKQARNDVITHNGFRDTGSNWAGTPLDEFMQVFFAGQVFADPRTRETVAEVAERMTGAFDQIISAHAGCLIGIVSHGDPLSILVDRIRHPDQVIPDYSQLVQELSLKPAQGLRLEILPGGQVEMEFVP